MHYDTSHIWVHICMRTLEGKQTNRISTRKKVETAYGYFRFTFEQMQGFCTAKMITCAT